VVRTLALVAAQALTRAVVFITRPEWACCAGTGDIHPQRALEVARAGLLGERGGRTLPAAVTATSVLGAIGLVGLVPWRGAWEASA